jgi:hypothetical protein
MMGEAWLVRWLVRWWSRGRGACVKGRWTEKRGIEQKGVRTFVSDEEMKSGNRRMNEKRMRAYKYERRCRRSSIEGN